MALEGIEHGLDQQDVGAAVEEVSRLLAIGRAQFVEADGAESRIGDVGRDRGGAVGRPDGPGDKARPAIGARCDLRRLLGETGAGEVQFGDHRLGAIVRLGNAGRREGVGGDNVGAGAVIGEVQFAHRLGLRQDEDVVVAAQIARPVGKAGAAITRFAELERLDFGAHGAVEHQDCLAGAAAQRGLDRRWWKRPAHATGSCARTPRRWQIA